MGSASSARSASAPEQLEVELNWIDDHIGGDHTYGVDIVIPPNKYEGMDSNLSADELTKMLVDMVPQEHSTSPRRSSPITASR